MRTLPFKQVDVFTDKPFYGNPVAVVIGAQDLGAAAMQRIAAWTNLSETTFLLPATQAGASYKLRIFTPRQELPFAGHPTVGSAHAALESGFAKLVDGRLRQECGAGVLDLTVEESRIYVRAPVPKVHAVEAPLFGKAQALRVDVGPVWIVVDMGKAQAVDELVPVGVDRADEPCAACHGRDGVRAHWKHGGTDPRTLLCAGARGAGGPGLRQRQHFGGRFPAGDRVAERDRAGLHGAPGHAGGTRRAHPGARHSGRDPDRRRGGNLR